MPEPAFRLNTCKKEAQQAKESGKFQLAITKFTQALSFTDGKTNARTKAELYHGRGEAYKMKRELSQALKDARECEKLDRKWIKVR